MINKGDTIHFLKRDSKEVVSKRTGSIYTGTIVTDKNTYSVDFISRWLEFGFLKIIKK